tara:strand:- start:534 stop:689 length:156 start_codon:yes stop_codon:yes gene_type:complete
MNGEKRREIVSTYESEVEKRLESSFEGQPSNFPSTFENHVKKIGKKKLCGN